MGVHMYGQTCGVRKTPRTDGTRKRSFARMYASMALHRRRVGERFGARGAGIRLLAAVCTFVHSQVVVLRKRALTYVTFVRTFAGVTANVTTHDFQSHVLFVADYADVASSATVVLYNSLRVHNAFDGVTAGISDVCSF